VALGHGTPLSQEDAAAAGQRARARYGIAPDAMLVGCFGGLSPDRRIPQALAALAAVRPAVPQAHLLLAGDVPPHYDLRADIARHGLTSAVTVTGYLASDAEFTDAIAACDVALSLRWPTAREVSGPWLRSLAAGKATVITDLAHLTGVPTIDPRTWRVATSDAPCAVAIDILDEDHSLRLALRRLGTDRTLRDALGRAARAYWQAHHSIATMVEGYRRLIDEARRQKVAAVELPVHLRDDGAGTLERLLEPFGLPSPLAALR
jgi:mannosyltransferase